MFIVKKFKRGDIIKKAGRITIYAKTPFWAIMKGNEIIEKYYQKYVAEAECEFLNTNQQ